MDERCAEVLVVGAGPAGVAAALRAAEAGSSVLVLDENPAAGGQIWRGEETGIEPLPEAAAWLARLARARNIQRLYGARVTGVLERRALLVERENAALRVVYDRLVIATGARERFVPFPGWTLPGVVGAGGLQAMAKGGLPVRGKRVVVAGSGPLLLAAAAYLRTQGAEIAVIAEQASWLSLLRFAARVLPSARKRRQAVHLREALAGVPFAPASWPLSAEGDACVQAVTLHTRRGVRRIACDYLACGFGLVPNLELAELLGCALRDGAVCVDQWQRTTLDGIYAAGEATGIGGLDLSLLEGEIAGYAVARQLGRAQALFARRARERRFGDALARAFALRGDLKALAEARTVVCRCEDVPYAQLSPHGSWRAAKIHTRCGMGACQGRVCGDAAKFLFEWSDRGARPPIVPVRIATLIGEVTR